MFSFIIHYWQASGLTLFVAKLCLSFARNYFDDSLSLESSCNG